MLIARTASLSRATPTAREMTGPSLGPRACLAHADQLQHNGSAAGTASLSRVCSGAGRDPKVKEPERLALRAYPCGKNLARFAREVDTRGRSYPCTARVGRTLAARGALNGILAERLPGRITIWNSAASEASPL